MTLSEACESRELGKSSGIYRIVCAANGRAYVGSAVCLRKRVREHFRQLRAGRHHSRHLQRAWNKHGAECFQFDVLEECPREELIAREQAHIDELLPEFNCSPTAGSQLGYRHSEDSRRKLSEAARRTRNFTGKKHSEESRQRISKAKRGRRLGPYGMDRIAKTAEAMRRAKDAMTESQVRVVRRLHAAGLPHIEVAQWVGRSYSAVADIVRGRTFRWVD